MRDGFIGGAAGRRSEGALGCLDKRDRNVAVDFSAITSSDDSNLTAPLKFPSSNLVETRLAKPDDISVSELSLLFVVFFV